MKPHPSVAPLVQGRVRMLGAQRAVWATLSSGMRAAGGYSAMPSSKKG